MHSDTDAFSDRIDTETPIAPARPMLQEHTVLSIVLMLLLSAAVLYAVNWSLREDRNYTYRWNFAGVQESEGPWTFPQAERAKTPEGVAYVAQDTGPGPALALEFDAGTVRQIRATISVTRIADGRPIPYVAEWYWAGPEEVAAAAGAWPFSTDRAKAFFEPDRNAPDLRQVEVYEHPLWKGAIAKAFISVKVPNRELGPYRIETKNIEFLE